MENKGRRVSGWWGGLVAEGIKPVCKGLQHHVVGGLAEGGVFVHCARLAHLSQMVDALQLHDAAFHPVFLTHTTRFIADRLASASTWQSFSPPIAKSGHRILAI